LLGLVPLDRHDRSSSQVNSLSLHLVQKSPVRSVFRIECVIVFVIVMRRQQNGYFTTAGRDTPEEHIDVPQLVSCGWRP